MFLILLQPNDGLLHLDQDLRSTNWEFQWIAAKCKLSALLWIWLQFTGRVKGLHYKSTLPATHYTYNTCSTLETHAMNVPAHSFCVGVTVRVLELFSYWVNRVLATQCTSDPALYCFLHFLPLHRWVANCFCFARITKSLLKPVTGHASPPYSGITAKNQSHRAHHL